MNSPTAAEVTALLAQWWHLYDAGEIEALGPLLTDDAGFRCRTDTGETDWEEFVRIDVSGRDTILYWQRKHRDASPHPPRQMTLNRVGGPAPRAAATPPPTGSASTATPAPTRYGT